LLVHRASWWAVPTLRAILRAVDQELLQKLQPGATVKVTQQIPYEHHTWVSEVRGQVVSVEQKPTGASFAHSRDGHLWLERLILRKTDGELMDLVLDQYTRVDVEAAPPAAPAAPAASPAAA
jgi:hypothetical protein